MGMFLKWLKNYKYQIKYSQDTYYLNKLIMIHLPKPSVHTDN